MAKEKKAYSTGSDVFVARALVVLLGVGIIPLPFAFATSFQQFIVTKAHLKGTFLGIWPIYDAPFVWLSNYRDLLFDQSFREALGRSLLFLIINLPIQLGLGLLISLLLHKPGNALVKNVARVALVVPMATTFAVVCLMGRLMFNSYLGINSFFWNLIFHYKPQWLPDPNLAFLSVSIMDCWQWTPFCALVLFSSLTMVPVEIEEAAKLETDKWWHTLRKIQLPFLLPGVTATRIRL